MLRNRFWIETFILAVLTTLPLVVIAQPAADVLMGSGRTAVARSFELLDNRMFLRVHVNGQGPFQFILDSGSTNVLALDTARKLDLPLEPAGQQSGAGSGTVESWTTTIDSLTLGDLRMTGQECLVLSLEPIVKAIGFDRVDGVLGYELFRQLVVTIDYDSSKVTFFQPQAFSAPKDCDIVPFGLRGHIPVVDGAVDGLEGRFLIDTGDRSSLTLFSPFVREHGLTSRYVLTPEVVTGWGIGGPIPARVTRVDTLRIHGSFAHGVVTRLPTSSRGAFASGEQAGSIGTGVLERFAVTFDFPNRRLYLTTNGTAHHRDAWDGAGMWLVRSDAGFAVFDVLEDGPADRAGIQAGDVIVAVDNRSSNELTLLDVRLLLSDERPGTVVRLEVRRESNSRVLALELERLL